MADNSDPNPDAQGGDARERAAILDANSAFYRCFARGDAAGMDALWSRREPVLCVHPGEAPIHGRDAVIASWAGILAAPPPVQPSAAQVIVVRGVGVVSCLEQIGNGTLAACNFFVWEDGEWRLVHHQAGALARLNPETGHPRGPLH